jgi:hypothetical protein
VRRHDNGSKIDRAQDESWDRPIAVVIELSNLFGCGSEFRRDCSVICLRRDYDHLSGDRRVAVLGHYDEVLPWRSGLLEFRNGFLRQSVRVHFIGCVLWIPSQALGAAATTDVDMKLLRTNAT